jgi:hypothetical protein
MNARPETIQPKRRFMEWPPGEVEGHVEEDEEGAAHADHKPGGLLQLAVVAPALLAWVGPGVHVFIFLYFRSKIWIKIDDFDPKYYYFMPNNNLYTGFQENLRLMH